jgi:hypothetical protein
LRLPYIHFFFSSLHLQYKKHTCTQHYIYKRYNVKFP